MARVKFKAELDNKRFVWQNFVFNKIKVKFIWRILYKWQNKKQLKQMKKRLR